MFQPSAHSEASHGARHSGIAHWLVGVLVGGWLALAGATPAHASHYVVDAAGGGDFTTIQAALDQLAVSARDSILVAPGDYPETLAFTSAIPGVAVVGTAGAGATSARTLTSSAKFVPSLWRVAGFTFTRDVRLESLSGIDFWRCAFQRTVVSTGLGVTNFHDCDFYGRTWFLYYGNVGVFDLLRFHGAPLAVSSSGYGDVIFSHCSFEGPADTLVMAHGLDTDPIAFNDCTFANAVNGVVAMAVSDGSVAPPTYGQGISLQRCVARDLSGTAIGFQDARPAGGPWSWNPQYLEVSNSRFERCGSAIRWVSPWYSIAYLTADTVLASTGDAITVSECLPATTAGALNGLVVEGGGGHGIVLRFDGSLGSATLAHSRVSHVAGDGIRAVADVRTPAGSSFFPSRIWDCGTDHNGGAGIRVASSAFSIVGNVAWANGDDGIALTTLHASERIDSVYSNTSVGNNGAGFRVQPPAVLTGIDQVVQHNLAVANIGAGLVVSGPFRGSVAFNDAWHDIGGGYAGIAAPADSNLAVDPLICNLPAGEFTLQAGSPCAPTGTYGLIGARPVGCAQAVGATPGAAPLAFGARPNPARGALVFSAPASGAGRLEVLDLLGRRVWTRALRAGESVRWDGRGEGGRIRPGIYLARFTGAGAARSSTVRFAWIE